MALFLRQAQKQSHIVEKELLIELNESLNSLEQIIQRESEKSSPRNIDRYVSLQFEHLRLRYEINALTIQSVADSGDDSPTTFSDEDSDSLQGTNESDCSESSDSTLPPPPSLPTQPVHVKTAQWTFPISSGNPSTQQTPKPLEATKTTTVSICNSEDSENLKIDEMNLQIPQQQTTQNTVPKEPTESITDLRQNEEVLSIESIKTDKSSEITSNKLIQNESTESIEHHLDEQQSNISNDVQSNDFNSLPLCEWDDNKKKEMNEDSTTAKVDEMNLQIPNEQITQNTVSNDPIESILDSPRDKDADSSESIKSSKSSETSTNDAIQSECTESIEHHLDEQQSNTSNDAQSNDLNSLALYEWDDEKKKEMNAKYDRFYIETLKSPKYIMAPMVDGSELPFRMMGRKYGCDLCYTPMAGAKSVIEHFEEDGHLDGRLLFHELDRPLIVQLASNDPEMIVKAVQIIESLGDICDGIDINLGCPQTVAKIHHFGAFLLDNAEIVRSMIIALKQQCTLPICAKIRILPTFKETLAFCDMLVDSGISMLAIHGRLRDKKYHQGPADLDTIRRIKQHYHEELGLNIPIISNGNTMTLQDAKDNLAFTKCDAIMSAYGLLRNPCLFDPKRTSIPWTPERGVRASWEYLNFVKKYGNQRNGELGMIHNAIRYHLIKLNIAFIKSENEEGNTRKDVQTPTKGLSDLMRNTTSMNEWTAFVEILEVMIGKKAGLSRAMLTDSELTLKVFDNFKMLNMFSNQNKLIDNHL